MTLGRHRFWHGIVAVALVGAGGCGLSDYQSRMDAQRERVLQFDEANRLLDDPINMPKLEYQDPKEGTQQEKAAWPFDVFLRLPKGSGITFKDKIVSPYDPNFVVFRYASFTPGAYNFFLAASRVADPNQKEPEPGKYAPNAFLNFVKTAMEIHYASTYKVQPLLDQTTKPVFRDVKVVTAYPNPDAPTTVRFSFFTYTDERNTQVLAKDRNAFDVYYHEKGGKQVCFVVHRPLQSANSASLKTAVETSLGTLDISSEAGRKRSEHRKAKTP
jgi:hypothetical protein